MGLLSFFQAKHHTIHSLFLHPSTQIHYICWQMSWALRLYKLLHQFLCSALQHSHLHPWHCVIWNVRFWPSWLKVYPWMALSASKSVLEEEMLHSQLEYFQKMENLMFSVLKSFCLLCWVRSFLPKFIPMTDFGSSGLVWMKLPCDKPGWGFRTLLQLQWVGVAREGREGTHLPL